MAIKSSIFLLFATLASAAITVSDPSDYADLTADAADNALKAIYDITPVLVQVTDIVGPYFYSGNNDTAIDHTTMTVDANDTSVLVITEGAEVNVSYSKIIKYGYSSNLFQASFFGVNGAVNIANKSVAYIDHTNITVHNGAANVFALGTGTTVYVSNTDLYSSGPTSHGLYAAGNATIYGINIRHYSGGNRCSSFAGDNPAGYLHISDSIAHTAGIGSAIFYALGTVWGNNIIGHAEKAPILFSDSNQQAYFDNVDVTAGLLAGTVMFSSMIRSAGAKLSFANSRLTTTGATMPALWFGNVIAEAKIHATELNTVSGILVIANASQVTQDFDHFAGTEENSAILPAEVTVVVSESKLAGDLVAYNQSSISWSLTSNSVWTGAAYSGLGDVEFAVSLDQSCSWTLTKDTSLQNFTNADTSMQNIESGGFNILYNASSVANSWLKGSTISLSGGGSLKPM